MCLWFLWGWWWVFGDGAGRWLGSFGAGCLEVRGGRGRVRFFAYVVAGAGLLVTGLGFGGGFLILAEFSEAAVEGGFGFFFVSGELYACGGEVDPGEGVFLFGGWGFLGSFFFLFCSWEGEAEVFSDVVEGVFDVGDGVFAGHGGGGVSVGVEAVGGLFQGLEGGVVGEGSPEVVVAEEATQEDEVGEVPGGLGGVEEGFEVVDELFEPGEAFGSFGEVDHGLGGVTSEVVEVGGGQFRGGWGGFRGVWIRGIRAGSGPVRVRWLRGAGSGGRRGGRGGGRSLSGGRRDR